MLTGNEKHLHTVTKHQLHNLKNALIDTEDENRILWEHIEFYKETVDNLLFELNKDENKNIK